MIKCLSDVFSDQGLFCILDGLPVNRTGALCVEEDASPELLRLYADVTARLGVELAGMQLPLTGRSPEDALTLKICENVGLGSCELRLAEGGIRLSGPTPEELMRGVEYLVTCYPWDGRKQSLAEMKRAAGVHQICRAVIDCAGLYLREVYGLKGDDTVAITPDVTEAGDRRAKAAGGETKEGGLWGLRSSYDRAKRHFKQNTNIRIVVDEYTADDAETVLTIALRLAMENYETVYPYGISEYLPGLCNVRCQYDLDRASVKKTEEGLLFSGSRENLAKLAAAFVSEESDPFQSVWISDVEDILSCKNELGQAARALELLLSADGSALGGRSVSTDGKAAGPVNRTAPSAPPVTLVTREYARGMVDREALEQFLSQRLGPVKVANFNDGKEVLHRVYTCTWEGDDFMELFSSEVLPLIKPGDQVRLRGLLSEDADIRCGLESKIRHELEERKARVEEVEILRSFKSGYCWIEERVLPALCALTADRPIAKVEIRFPYLLNARGDDSFEDESAPNYGIHLDDPLKFFDIPTRWLQELFPVDELIAEKLGISRDLVEFIRDDELPCTYRFSCMAQDGSMLYTDDFTVKYVQKHYIEKYPQIGLTHVTTGWLQAEINGRTVLDTRVVTDPEKVWDILENKVIPTLECYLVKRYGVAGLINAQPLFNRLQMNIVMSEMDYDLGYRQERISTPEAMQEDIYFYLLDWFKTFGERECGRELDNVGLIMPEPESHKSADTRFEVILYEDLAKGAELRQDQGVTPLPPLSVSLEARELRFENDSMLLEVQTREKGTVQRAALLNEMIEGGVIEFFAQRPVTIGVSDGTVRSEIRLPAFRPTLPKISRIQREHMIERTVVDYEQYLDLLRFYQNRKDLRIEPVETTYKGRKIFSIECIRRRESVCYSACKLKTGRITALFTARHHGNESSSLNSSFMLLDRLLTDKQDVLDKINVVLVPFINIDGGMLHCSVQRKHPKWLCHPARYNSAGFEFRKDFNNPDSIYGEARLLGKLWNRYLFDVITDNHGFEGHELCQPFSGYISPWYKSFWVPRALYYGYVWYQGHLQHMVRLGDAIRRNVSDAINADKEIYEWNQDFAERFYKYAERWFPDLFRLDRYNNVVFYWIDTDQRPREANYGVQNPEITALDWTTEVADETAVGKYMETNARAHLISDLAVFDVLRECPLETDRSVSKTKDSYTYVSFRRHPLFSEGDAEL